MRRIKRKLGYRQRAEPPPPPQKKNKSHIKEIEVNRTPIVEIRKMYEFSISISPLQGLSYM